MKTKKEGGFKKNPIKGLDGTKIKKITRKAKGGGAATKGLNFYRYISD